MLFELAICYCLRTQETLLMELKKTNDEVSENQNNGDYSLRASEPFMKHYATVLVQLKEASGQACGFHHKIITLYSFYGDYFGFFFFIKIKGQSDVSTII